MKVRATQQGFYGNAIRELGTVFDVEESKFAKSWMEKVDPPKPKAPEKPIVEPKPIENFHKPERKGPGL